MQSKSLSINLKKCWVRTKRCLASACLIITPMFRHSLTRVLWPLWRPTTAALSTLTTSVFQMFLWLAAQAQSTPTETPSVPKSPHSSVQEISLTVPPTDGAAPQMPHLWRNVVSEKACASQLVIKSRPRKNCFFNLPTTMPVRKEKTLSQFAHHFFPQTVSRGMVRPTVHFTEEALKQMTPYKKALVITNLICSLMPSSRFNILEVCAGIGGNTIAFAKCASINSVVSFESDCAVAEMLKANLKLTNTSSFVKVCREEATCNKLLHLACISGHPVAVFVDPPWGLVPPYHDPLQTPMNAKRECVMDWVSVLLGIPSVHVVMIKVPSGYSAPRNTRFRSCIYRKIAKMDMLYFYPHNKNFH